jgi:hypothetical protein
MLDSSKICTYSAFVMRQTHVVHVFGNSCSPACSDKRKHVATSKEEKKTCINSIVCNSTQKGEKI